MPDELAIYPTTIPAEAPSYVPAVAVGDYTELPLGTTDAGTSVSVWYLPGEEDAARAGTANLVEVFDFFEREYGPYPYGSKVGSVSANWGPGAYGGMEHHPYWHVASGAMDVEELHAHEAAHGWYGNGVRIACWEDFVLSEGTASYLAARALEQVGGPNLWPGYVEWLDGMCAGYGATTVAMPETCGQVDILYDPLWSGVPYMKGACFLEDVADLVGAPELDDVLASFYADHAGEAAEMEALIDAIKAAHPADAVELDQLVTDWLRSPSCPADYAERCGQHVPR